MESVEGRELVGWWLRGKERVEQRIGYRCAEVGKGSWVKERVRTGYVERGCRREIWHEQVYDLEEREEEGVMNRGGVSMKKKNGWKRAKGNHVMRRCKRKK